MITTFLSSLVNMTSLITTEYSCFFEYKKEVEENIKCEACLAFYLCTTSLINSIIQEQESNKFNNTRAGMLESTYHMT